MTDEGVSSTTEAAAQEVQAIIETVPQRKSLLTPDETVVVTFKESPNIAPTSATLSDSQHEGVAKLSSPEMSDDEGASQYQRESLVTPGFVKLDPQTFEEFGENVKELELQREKEDEEWKAGRRTSMRNSRPMSAPLEEKEKGVAMKLEFEEKSTLVAGDESVDGGSDNLLSRWANRHSLNRIDQLPQEEQAKRISATQLLESDSENEDDDFMEETVSRESLHLRYLDARAVYLKVQNFEQQRQERGYTEVLKMRDQLQTSKNDGASSRKILKKRPSSGVIKGNVNAKLEVFGESADHSRPSWKKKSGNSKSRHHPGSPIKTSLFKDEFTFDSIPSSPENSALVEAYHEEIDGAMDDMSPSHGKLMSSLSSRASTTAFETIREAEENEESGGNVDIKHSSANTAIKDEGSENIAPLPKLHRGLSRRLSEERLRLDGLLPAESSRDGRPSKEQPRKDGDVVLRSTPTKSKPRSIPNSAGPKHQSHVHFHQESVDSTVQHGRTRKPQNRPVSAPPFHQRTVAHTTQSGLGSKELLEAESKVATLLSRPQCSNSNFPSDSGRGSLKIWKQEVSNT